MSIASERPWLSIIVAAYNAEATIGRTLDSVLAQTVADWELIVIDDGSTDDTAQVVAEHAARDPRIRLRFQSNSGTAAARNAGADLAMGRYWCFLDADDMLLADYVAAQSEFVCQHPEFDIYSSNAELMKRDGSCEVFWRGPRFQHPFTLVAEDQAIDSSILLMAVIDPRVFHLVGGFRSLHSEDYDFWLRALLAGARHVFNPAVLAVYRRRKGSRTTDLIAEAQSFVWIQRDALSAPDLSGSQRAALVRAVAFSEARVGRRQMETALLNGEYQGARTAYWRTRGAFPNKAQYIVGLVLMLASPALYASIKRARLV